MSIEIDVLNGDASWPRAKPLLAAAWPPAEMAQKAWAHVEWANADLRVLVEADDSPVCHVGLYFRDITRNGRKFLVGGIGGVATRPDRRRRGYASMALDAAMQTFRDHEAVDWALLVCEPHNFAFYEARGWQRFNGAIIAEQNGEAVPFNAMTPYVHNIRGRAPQDGTLDLCGLPW